MSGSSASVPSSVFQDWTRQGIDAHFAQVAAGLHDDACEWRASGHFICHCAKRTRIAGGLTEAPAISYQHPLCLGCLNEVLSNGDGWSCEHCHVDWNYETPDGTQGVFNDDFGDLNPDAERSL